jgi:hypothetical protein
LIAVPLAAAIGVLMRFALRQYYASPLYDAAPAAPALLPADTSAPAANASTGHHADLGQLQS